MYYVSVDVRQTEISSLMTERQAFVVDAKEMKTCCMKVMNVDFVFGNPETELISGPVGEATFQATACHPDTETFFVMVSTGSSFLAGSGAMFLNHRCTTEFAAPDHKCFVQQAALFQILNGCGASLVDFVTEFHVVTDITAHAGKPDGLQVLGRWLCVTYRTDWKQPRAMPFSCQPRLVRHVDVCS